MDVSRRKVLKVSVAASVVAAGALSAGCSDGEVVNRKLTFTPLAEGLREAERLVSVNAQTAEAGFTLPQTLIHCAQSIEYSLAGFPEMQSALFQNTVGSAAFKAFSWRGRMSHNLAEAIPGAELIGEDTSAEGALARLVSSVQQFEKAGEVLMPHFAYGKLDRTEYSLAHAMHLANHFSAIDA